MRDEGWGDEVRKLAEGLEIRSDVIRLVMYFYRIFFLVIVR